MPRGGNRKGIAPEGYYTAAQAKKKLGVSHTAFYAMVGEEVARVTPPHSTIGYYDIAAIDRMADERALFSLQNLPEKVKYRRSEFGVATEADLEGIYNVITSFGWPATPVETRRKWYKVNDRIDYVVRYHGLVIGYINCMPYRWDAMEAMLSGKRRGWDIRAHDIMQFVPGNSYDCFVGIAVRKDVKNPEYYAKRLLIGFLGEIIKMAQQGITIRRLFATSDQEDGIQISQDLGFVRLPAQKGDLFGRFSLNLLTAQTQLPKRYRQFVKTP